MKRVAKGFSGRDTPLFPTMMVQAQEELGENIAILTETHLTHTITQPSTSKPQKKQKPRNPKRQDTEEIRSSDPIINVADGELPEDTVPTHSNDPPLLRVNTLRTKEIANLNKRVKSLERKRKSRTLGLKKVYKVRLSARVESFADEESLGEEDSSKHERISDIDANQDIYLVNVNINKDIFDGDCDNVTTDDNEDAYLSSNSLLDVNHVNQCKCHVTPVIAPEKDSIIAPPSTPPGNDLNIVVESGSSWLDYLGPLTSDELDSVKRWSYSDPDAKG
nr:hypothetical protein CTI12_AA443780 [Tanacetum cinerariifolium]